MPVLHKTVDLRKGPLQLGGGTYEQKLNKALNEYGRDGWAIQTVIDTYSIVFTKEVSEDEFIKAQEKAEGEQNSIMDSKKNDSNDSNNDEDSEDDEEDIDLDSMTVAQLLACAQRNNIEVNPNLSKTEIYDIVNEELYENEED